MRGQVSAPAFFFGYYLRIAIIPILAFKPREKMMQTKQLLFQRRIRIVLFVLGVALLTATGILLAKPAFASPAVERPGEDSPQNEACLSCHNRPDLSRPMVSGETLPLSIDPAHFSDSVHSGLECTDCHQEITSFPHQKLEAQSLRDVSLQFYLVCKNCHAEQYDLTLDSVHQKALAGGNNQAAICTDCHNPHTQTELKDSSGSLLPEARVEIPQKCAQCHETIYEQYKQSVHGSALTAEINPDVPTCIDCHGVHNIGDPTETSFHVNTPQLCAKCHTNSEIMDKYGISTDVIDTYVADFHGTTVTMFESQSPDQATDKPVCTSCHGIHGIKKVDDPEYGLEMKQNLLQACQKCHPDAGPNFPSAWMSHYIPGPDHYQIVYYVNLFYKFFIPGVLGPMVIFVLSDIVRRLIDRRKGAKHA